MINTNVKRLFSDNSILQFFIDNCSISKILIDSTGNIIYANKACCSMLGYTLEELDEIPFYKLDTTNTKEFWPHFWTLILKNKQVEMETLIVKKDQNTINVHLRAVSLRTNNTTTYAVAYLNNVSKEKLLEDNLFLQSNTFDNSPIATYYLNMSGEIIKCNKETAKMLGYTLEELTGMSVSKFDVTNTTPQLIQQILQSLQYDTINNFLFTVRSTDNSIKKIKTFLKRIKNRDEELVIGYSININEDLQLKEKLQLMEFSLNNSKISTLISDNIGNIVYANQQLLELLQYSRDEILSKTIYNLDHTIQNSQDFNSIIIKFDSNLIQSIETTLERKDHSEFPAEIFIKKLLFENKTYFAINIIDITEKKYFDRLIEEEHQVLENQVKERTEALETTLHDLKAVNTMLEKNDIEKNNFLSFLSHEFKTPLNGILGFAELLDYGIYGQLSPKQKQTVSYIKSSAEHLNLLLKDLLDISRIEKGMLDLNTQIIDLSDFLNTFIPVIKHLCNINNIQLQVELDNNVANIHADKTRLRQILYNLFSNAIKYSKPGDQITFKIKKFSRGKVKFSIIDNGSGIEQHQLNSIFEEYYQINTIRDQALGGSGLGLFLTRRLVEMQRGQVGAESEIGKGSTFWFILPVKG